jgi:hypothetical protein
MEPYQRAAVLASLVELHVDAHVVGDDLMIDDYQGPRLIAIAHAGKLVTIADGDRAIAELDVDRMQRLLALALATEHERYSPGVDTAIARPITSYDLRVCRMLDRHDHAGRLAVNHYGPRALGPRWTALITELRDAAGRASPPSADAWDFAAAWAGPLDLGPAWIAGQVVRLPSLAAAFEHTGPVYLRAGQPPQRSELYCHDGTALVHIDGDRRAVPATQLRDWHVRDRWILPCGGGSVTVAREWQRPARFVVHTHDPARPIYVQRG